MGPETLLANAAAFLQALLVPAAVVAAVLAVLVYGFSKMADNPNMTRWSKGAAVGSCVLFGGTAVISIIQNVSQRMFG